MVSSCPRLFMNVRNVTGLYHLVKNNQAIIFIIIFYMSHNALWHGIEKRDTNISNEWAVHIFLHDHFVVVLV